jgi:two-component system alkaline phosphatase synthesis response regulator PhoP
MKKILIIEDDNILQRAINTALVDANYSVAEANDGSEGIKKAKSESPDLILLDLLMPKKDGWEVLEELKKNKDTKNIPVLVLTVYEGEDSISKCMKLGAKGYFLKSNYSLDEIVEKVKESI